MPEPITSSTRGRANRTRYSEMADKMYPDKDSAASKSPTTKSYISQTKPREVDSPIVQDFLMNPASSPVPHGGVQAAPTMGEQRDREAKAFAHFLSKIPEKECMKLAKDIGLEKDTIAKLSRMVKEGGNFQDYGLTPHSDDRGYINHEIVDNKSYTYQHLIRLLESDAWRSFTDRLWVSIGTALTGSLNKPRAMRERERSEWVLQGLTKSYERLCKK